MKIHLPYITLFGVPILPLCRIQAAGFDGVEIHLINYRDTSRVSETIARATRLGLKVSVHQAWSLEESPTFWFNHLLNFLGYLPHAGYTLAGHLPAGDLPTVVYASRWQEVTNHPNWQLQTCDILDEKQDFKISYNRFVRLVTLHKFAVVFDTQHVLEFMLNQHGVEDLPFDPKELLKLLTKAWDDLGSYVREIHLNDCNPGLGHHTGRNIRLGEGILPLKEFIQYVKQSGWDGIVTPEVSPFKLIAGDELEKLHKMVVELFNA
jgi:sugar phosphate isomerase/epimerase